jgi:hypothetical protein
MHSGLQFLNISVLSEAGLNFSAVACESWGSLILCFHVKFTFVLDEFSLSDF